MNKCFRYNFINLVWDLLKDENTLLTLMKCKRGVDIIMTLLKNATREQKDFFKKKNYTDLKHKLAENKLILLLI